MKRRHFVLGLGAAGVAAAFALKPSNEGAPYTPYFNKLNQLLRKQGPYRPTMIVDLDRLDTNIQHLHDSINPESDYRVVAKSLPSPKLLAYIMEAASTNKLMVFHQPFLNHIARDFPKSDVLMGKPLPVKSAELFYRQLSDSALFSPEHQLQWLIDSHERLLQYQWLAKSLGIKMRINIELDVGLHRGGLKTPAQLKPILDAILSNPENLEFSGFMGYDPHVVSLPGIIKSADQAFAQSQATYQQFLVMLTMNYPQVDITSLCLNGAGSPSLLLHKSRSVINDVAAGTCLVKPSHYDIPTLGAFIPAAFIATPVLKKKQGMEIPAIEWTKSIASRWNPNVQQTYFIYGGQWLADFESPKGLRSNALFGASSNQAMVNGSSLTSLKIDDHVFLRPAQSEAVFLQFGDILTYRDGELGEWWPVLS